MLNSAVVISDCEERWLLRYRFRKFDRGDEALGGKLQAKSTSKKRSSVASKAAASYPAASAVLV